MEVVLKVSAIAVIAALCAVVVRKQTPEIGMVLALVAGCLILSLAIEPLQGIIELMQSLCETAGLAPAVVSPVIKTTGIAILTRVSAEFCRDAKEGGIASFLEVAGSAGALFVCLPLFKTVLGMITGLL
jgi:stage III sporulation protein AD